MNRLWAHFGAVATVAVGGALLVPGCANDDSTLFILHVLAAQSVSTTAAGSCMFTSDPTQPYLSEGTFDIGLLDLPQDTYTAQVLVGNQLLPQASTSAPQTETSIIEITQAEVKIYDAAHNFVRAFTTYTSASLSPASGTTPSYAPLAVPMVDEQSAQETVAGRWLPPLVTYTQLTGTTLGGQTVKSNVFEFPVYVCVGCLVDFSQQNNPLYCAPNCVGNGNAPPTTEPCVVGQDTPIDCSLCKANNPEICDPAPTTSCGTVTTSSDAGTGTTSSDAGSGSSDGATASDTGGSFATDSGGALDDGEAE